MVGPAAKRAAVAHLQAVMSPSERRARSIVGADRKIIRYGSSRPPGTALRGRLRDLANERRRPVCQRPALPYFQHRRRREECLGAIPDTSISGRRVARELTAIVERAASQE